VESTAILHSSFAYLKVKSDLVWQIFLDFPPLTEFFLCSIIYKDLVYILDSVPDPDPWDLLVFGPPGSGSFYQQTKKFEKP
jgi:hypothetical protein